MSEINLIKSIEYYAEEAAYNHLLGNGFERALCEFLGRLVQDQPGKFLELKERELSRYPAYKLNRKLYLR